MSGMRSPRHLDDFTLLRYAAADLDAAERGAVDEHLDGCSRCNTVLESLAKLDEEMRILAKSRSATDGLDAADPFARRPEAAPRPAARPAREAESLAVAALEASEKGVFESGRILAAAKTSPSELKAFLSGLPLSDLSTRFALLYSMQETGLEIAESPVRALSLALSALDRLEAEDPASSPTLAERILPLPTLTAQAHLLAAQGRNWTGELDRAKRHFEKAYEFFGDSTGDEISLAIVELHEAQRRAFAGDPRPGLSLAGRARATFAETGLEDYEARARVVEGICLTKLDRGEEALEAFRSSLPVFQKHRLWSNYVGAINALGSCLMLLGRLDEARREYARVLRTVSRDRHAAWVGYIRNGLALVLFQARSYREAALAFLQASRLFRDLGNIANALIASLYEIECWALCGQFGRAAQRFEIFRTEVARHDALDPAIVRQLEAALSGRDPNLEEVALLTESAGRMLRDCLERKSG
jgi:tetratricopeptide (TPR) repeat protein